MDRKVDWRALEDWDLVRTERGNQYRRMSHYIADKDYLLTE